MTIQTAYAKWAKKFEQENGIAPYPMDAWLAQAAEKASLVQQRDELLKKAVEQAQEIERLKGESLPWAKRSVEQDKEIERLRSDALDDVALLNWTEIMREGALVTWVDAETLGDRVVARLDAARAALEQPK